MRTTTHGQNLTQLTRFAAVFPVNAYLVREDDGLTLVDTGVVGSAGAILAAARAAGAAIRRIALTHAHGDHAGALDALHRALPDAAVLVSARDARFLRGDKTLDPDEPQDPPRGGYRRTQTRPTRELADGDLVGSLRVVAAPGHTPGQVAFFDPRDGTLIAGDAFQTNGGLAVAGVVRWRAPLPGLVCWHRPTALASAQTLRALAPTRLAVGHGDVLEDPAAALDRAIAAAARKVDGSRTP